MFPPAQSASSLEDRIMIRKSIVRGKHSRDRQAENVPTCPVSRVPCFVPCASVTTRFVLDSQYENRQKASTANFFSRVTCGNIYSQGSAGALEVRCRTRHKLLLVITSKQRQTLLLACHLEQLPRVRRVQVVLGVLPLHI